MTEYIKREDALQHKRKMRCADFHGGFWDFIVRCEDVERIPAADVVEVRHGEWEQTTEPIGWSDVNCIECSACGENWIMGEELCVDDYKDGWKYCPNCGAKMDGKGEDNAVD